MAVSQPLSGYVIETERTWMRELELSDVDALHKVIGDREAMGDQARTLNETHAWIRYHRSGYARHGFSLWALIAKDTGELIGDCGVFSRNVSGNDEFELGVHVRRDQWRRGIATEATTAVLIYARDHLGARRVVSITEPTNTRSIRLMEPYGWTLERTIQLPNRDGVMEPRLLYAMSL
jgi:RimJ/RimL family protein N-acetyltransferase